MCVCVCVCVCVSILAIVIRHANGTLFAPYYVICDLSGSTTPFSLYLKYGTIFREKMY
jgi:hypothetical protein